MDKAWGQKKHRSSAQGKEKKPEKNCWQSGESAKSQLLVLLRRLELMQLLLLLRGRRWLLLRMQAGWMLMRRNLRTTLAILPPHRGQVGYINGALADGN